MRCRSTTTANTSWLAELDQRFQLGEVGENTNKITWCQLLISATGSSILSSLEEEATWEDAKEALLTRLGIGSVRDEAWAALKNLKKGSKDIVELAGGAEKLAKRLHPRDEEASERHAVDAFLGALDRTLAAEVQKLVHKTMEDVVAAARQIEKMLDEQTDTKMEQIRLLKKGSQGGQPADRCSPDSGPTCSRHGRCFRPTRSNRCSRSTTSCHTRLLHLPGLQ